MSGPHRLSLADALEEPAPHLFAVAVQVLSGTPTRYVFLVAFHGHAPWRLVARYSAVRAFRNRLRSLTHKAPCPSPQDPLLSLLEFEFPSRRPFALTSPHVLRERRDLLETFATKLLNLHARCLQNGRGSCPIADEIRSFFGMDNATDGQLQAHRYRQNSRLSPRGVSPRHAAYYCVSPRPKAVVLGHEVT
ncbi:hypothetical protein SPRG_03612 [Saprolegnia parasitica CBS 223.65]|uniref:PX domain-containing protein n=1 Tax=Saprolegnia parasitica (strain CBS 223.65) TaxID=695850 RepID=A0A067CM05_SAPPC|nr:hypothetical protein SPRG_03612 [Saprolegnia parasitica CBS 223.65]KDO31694.1 hypothetical protein SPRG_03612 [Saprolegnia parasitica CBS 223.65]|eukprot:XP_012197580.1 hypothetical protein SPRG_03612 [Saprolegnia parasitica CBS 223.65]